MFVLAILLLYGLALYLPALWMNNEAEKPVPGWMAVLLGAFALLLFQPAVFANPAIVLGGLLLAAGRSRAATGLGVIGVACALSTLFMYDPDAPPPIGGNGTETITALQAGYYCWLGSAVVLWAGGYADLCQTKSSRSGCA